MGICDSNITYGIAEVTVGGGTASEANLGSLILSSLTLTDKVRQELPWLMFADDIVRSSRSRRKAEANLEVNLPPRMQRNGG